MPVRTTPARAEGSSPILRDRSRVTVRGGETGAQPEVWSSEDADSKPNSQSLSLGGGAIAAALRLAAEEAERAGSGGDDGVAGAVGDSPRLCPVAHSNKPSTGLAAALLIIIAPRSKGCPPVDSRRASEARCATLLRPRLLWYTRRRCDVSAAPIDLGRRPHHGRTARLGGGGGEQCGEQCGEQYGEQCGEQCCCRRHQLQHLRKRFSRADRKALRLPPPPATLLLAIQLDGLVSARGRACPSTFSPGLLPLLPKRRTKRRSPPISWRMIASTARHLLLPRQTKRRSPPISCG